MDKYYTDEEVNVFDGEKVQLRENSFEAQQIKCTKNIENAYKMLGEKIADLNEIRHEEFFNDEEDSDNKVKQELQEDIRDIRRYIRKLENEVAELDILISCRDEKSMN